MIELTFHNTKHHTRTRGRVPEAGTMNLRQVRRISEALCPKGCCSDPIHKAIDLDGQTWVREGIRMRRS